MARKRRDPNAGPPELAALFNGVADLSRNLERKAFRPEPRKTHPERATEGMTFRLPGWHGGKRASEILTVGPKCSENAGQWVCTTHGERFSNQFEKDGHIHDRQGCVLAWICFSHGPEVP